jgi:hypothetical protein
MDQPERIFIEIPAPTDRNRVATDRAWVQPLIEAMLNGGRAWLDGAELVATPTLHSGGAWAERQQEASDGA